MWVVGLTGGIGSGKTTVAKMFEHLGVPVYIADVEAKKLTNRSKVIRRKLIELLGEEAYLDKEINKKYVADKIFSNSSLLLQVNQIIHPKVRSHFNRWLKRQVSPYVIKEAAILFENGGYKECDKNILVVAPKDQRIERLLDRDVTSIQQIENRMQNQWEDEKKIPMADYVIHNVDLEKTRMQVTDIHEIILESIDN